MNALHSRRSLAARAATAALAALALLAITSCATAPQTADDVRIADFLATLDAAAADEAAARSEIPFVFDREVLIRESDVELLWQFLKEGDFQFGAADIGTVVPVVDPLDVGSGFQLEAAGRRFELEPVSAVEVRTRAGNLVVFLEGRGLRGYALRGIRRSM